ncbi:SH3 domain-containing protein [Ornithinibacillus gellani]|uniref:N-acetylmuramoyl-L-alanine amidase n=1 Tax=Ornithinibacillus gellani TaxID=2293253 RepID=UPI000F46847F|nr:N-acetylmuramoyl-L-alanine amidase [Ornithinibacillus gellani]TQS72030.1 SH3 domain-containing protein [Ornithinibacillus gellani]
MRKLRFLSICGFMLLLSVFFIPAVQAESGQVYEVTTNLLNVRDTPARDGNIIGQLRPGNKVTVFKESYGWAQTYYAGQVAWVAKHHLVPVSAAATNQASSASESADQKASTNNITVQASGVNVRSGPGTSYKIIDWTTTGKTYTLLETASGWHKVALGNGKTGWIAGWLTNQPTKVSTAAPKTATKSTTSNAQPTKAAKSGSLQGYNIVLDPGHGGKDPGAIGFNGVYEKNVINATTDVIAQHLRNAGATVILTRSNDSFISLDERVRISSLYQTHAFISIHYNAFPGLAANGVSTHYYSAADRQLASALQQSIVQYTGRANRGIMQDSYRVLRTNNDTSVLLELGFITNPSELAVIQSADYQNQVGAAVVQGLKNHFFR